LQIASVGPGRAVHQIVQEYSVFTHLSSQKAEEYRRVLAAFSQARSAFVIHLRPSELARATGMAEEALEPVLGQLHEWGNLDRSRDHVDAASIEEFYRVKWLYQLSVRGEAAERALEVFEESIHQPGELQTEALRDIIDYLEAIRRLLGESAGAGEADFGKFHQQFNHLDARFEEFTVQAQRFMQFLQSTIELHDLTLEDFIDYKDRLIDYLQRFVNDLITSASEIEQIVTALEAGGVRDRFAGIARRARADALDPNDPEMLAAERQRREDRWDGLRLWFLGDAGGRSQAETLRARAREAIPALLIALQSFHDRRESGSDRQRDWRQLARWFAEAPDDSAAHRLWRVAFAMTPARHLRINEETLERREQAGESVRTSWLEAEPMWLEPRLRKSGRAGSTGRVPEMVDLSRERELLRRMSAEENAQIARAHRLLARGEPMWLSDFAELESAAFDLLLDLLGRAMTAAAGRSQDEFPVVATSTDGSLCIELASPADPQRTVRICTSAGTLRGPDHRVTIRAADGVRLTTPAA
jgi:uncharacterized protein (TIGR02677 family)